MESVLVARPKDRDNVRVVEAGGRLRLALEALQLLVENENVLGQNLDSYPARKQPLLSLVHNSHTAAADLSNQGEVANLAGQADRWGTPNRGCVFRLLIDPQLFQHGDSRKQLLNLPGITWMLGGVIRHRGAFTFPAAQHKLIH
ncbi:MAG: hypothetical protein A2W31_16430 [Planctomycetes bacterium RBG_16_64_10]|nr:MAG: hypothetical protein A2W31_16430 [Planctomycetes bacterium RBG_16_64_10]